MIDLVCLNISVDDLRVLIWSWYESNRIEIMTCLIDSWGIKWEGIIVFSSIPNIYLKLEISQKKKNAGFT